MKKHTKSDDARKPQHLDVRTLFSLRESFDSGEMGCPNHRHAALYQVWCEMEDHSDWVDVVLNGFECGRFDGSGDEARLLIWGHHTVKVSWTAPHVYRDPEDCGWDVMVEATRALPRDAKPSTVKLYEDIVGAVYSHLPEKFRQHGVRLLWPISAVATTVTTLRADGSTEQREVANA
jgi:hypothetical protein